MGQIPMVTFLVMFLVMFLVVVPVVFFLDCGDDSKRVDLYSGKHNGKFRIAQEEGETNCDQRKLQVETDAGWKDVKTWVSFLGDGRWMTVSHDSENIDWFAKSIIEQYKKATTKTNEKPYLIDVEIGENK